MPRPGLDYDGGYDGDQWYGEPRHYQDRDMREYRDEDMYLRDEYRYYEAHAGYGDFHRNSPPHRNQEGPYPQPPYSRDDLRHQLSARKSGRSHYFRGRGRGSGPHPRPAKAKKVKEDRDYRTAAPSGVKRDRSPVHKESATPATPRSGSDTGSRNVPEEMEKGQTSQEMQQKSKDKPSVVVSQTPSSSVDKSPCSSASSKEQPSASAAKSAEEEEAATGSAEPKLTPEKDFKARRSEAIKTKALEIEENYRKDCQTFCTVVKMLVAKDPRLETLLRPSLDENLQEIKEHCLGALKSFVTELDQVLEQPDTSA